MITTLCFVPVSASFAAVPDRVIETFLSKFSLHAFARFERVADDSLSGITAFEIEGFRFVYDWPAGSRHLRWCVRAAPLDVAGAVAMCPSFGAVEGLLGYVTAYTSSMVFRSVGAARAAIDDAVAQLEAGRLPSWMRAGHEVSERIKWLKTLSVAPLRLCAVEARCARLPVGVVKARMAAV